MKKRIKIQKLEPVIVKKIREKVNSYNAVIDKITKRYYGYEVIARPYVFSFDENGNMKDVIFYCEHC